MASVWNRFFSLLGLSKRNGNGQVATQQTLEKRISAFPRLSEWVIDPYHSTLEFGVIHMGLVEVRGRFRRWEAKFQGTSPDFSQLSVEVEIDIASIQTDMEARDAYLCSPDFFDVEKYPKAFFRSTRIAWRPMRKFCLDGELTLKGITNPVTLDGELKSLILKDIFGQPRVAFWISTFIDRRLWGLSWQKELEGGEMAIDNFVRIDALIELATPQAMAALYQMLASMGATKN